MPSLAQRCPSLRITHANQCTSRGCSSDRAAPVGGQSVDGGPGRFCRLDGQAYPVAALWRAATLWQAISRITASMSAVRPLSSVESIQALGP